MRMDGGREHLLIRSVALSSIAEYVFCSFVNSFISLINLNTTATDTVVFVCLFVCLLVCVFV